MKQSDRQEFEDIQYLVNTKEWRVYVKFLKERAQKLKDQVIKQVRDCQGKEAEKTVAVIADIERQVLMFKQRLEELGDEDQSQ